MLLPSLFEPAAGQEFEPQTHPPRELEGPLFQPRVLAVHWRLRAKMPLLVEDFADAFAMKPLMIPDSDQIIIRAFGCLAVHWQLPVCGRRQRAAAAAAGS